MVRINWTEQALDDLLNIKEFIAQDSLQYSKIQIKRIRDKSRILIKYPMLGRIVPELSNENVREIIFGYYRIIYHIVSKSRVDILTVYHTSRLLNL